MPARFAAWFVLAFLPTILAAEPAELDLGKAEQLVIEQTNAFRKKQGLEPVTVNEKLTKTAEYFAGFMAKTTKYGHEADEKTPAKRAEEHGYDYCLVSENIAYQFDPRGFTTEDLGTKFTTGWKESPGHRKNMLDPNATETAVVIARSPENGYYYAVQLFGRPKSAAFEFRITNATDDEVKYTLGDQEFTLPTRVIRTHMLCVPEKLVLTTETDDDPTVTPSGGEQYTITSDGGKLAISGKKP